MKFTKTGTVKRKMTRVYLKKDVAGFLCVALSAAVVSGFLSCDADAPPAACAPVFYYSGNTKVFVEPVTDRVWIELDTMVVPKSRALHFLARFSFLDTGVVRSNTPLWRGGPVGLRDETDCAGLNERLKILNREVGIRAATPCLSFPGGNSAPDLVLLPEVLAAHNPNVITDIDFIRYAEGLGLVFVKSMLHEIHVFRVKDVVTGWEAMEISNKIYEGNKANFAHPNFIALNLRIGTFLSPPQHLPQGTMPTRLALSTVNTLSLAER
jgi:hypothetical protein